MTEYTALITNTGATTQKVLSNSIGEGVWSGAVLTVVDGFPLDRTVYNKDQLTRLSNDTMQLTATGVTDYPVQIFVYPSVIFKAVTGFAATPGATSIDLVWNNIGADEYVLYWGIDSYGELYRGALTSFSLTGLLENSEFNFYIEANKAGFSTSLPVFLTASTFAP